VKDKIKFVVLENHTFCAVYPLTPNWGQILTSFISRGASKTWHDGIILLAGEKTRPATQADFKDFKLELNTGYKDARYYDYPQN
jgi:hypothetical protein